MKNEHHWGTTSMPTPPIIPTYMLNSTFLPSGEWSSPAFCLTRLASFASVSSSAKLRSGNFCFFSVLLLRKPTKWGDDDIPSRHVHAHIPIKTRTIRRDGEGKDGPASTASLGEGVVTTYPASTPIHQSISTIKLNDQIKKCEIIIQNYDDNFRSLTTFTYKKIKWTPSGVFKHSSSGDKSFFLIFKKSRCRNLLLNHNFWFIEQILKWKTVKWTKIGMLMHFTFGG